MTFARVLGLPTKPPTTADMLRRAEEVAEQLQGTGADLTDFATQDEANDSRFCARVDDLVFKCEACGWWCEACEESEGGPGVCLECELGGY